MKEDGALASDESSFSQSELHQMITTKNIEAMKRMVIFVIRETIRKNKNRDWVDYLEKNRQKISKKYQLFMIGFWDDTEPPKNFRDLLTTVDMRLDRDEDTVGMYSDEFGLPKALFINQADPKENAVTLLHELQHAADAWLEIMPLEDKKTKLLKLVRTVFNPYSRYTLFAAHTLGYGLDLYQYITGMKDTNISVEYFYYLLGFGLMQVSKKTYEWSQQQLDQHYWQGDEAEKSARETAKSWIVTENAPVPIIKN